MAGQQVAYFFGGLVLANSSPHLISGVTGRPFQTPFANPPGKGQSPSMINVLWGFGNLVVAYFLIFRVGDFDLRKTSSAAPFGAGILAGVIMCARLFAYLHGGTKKDL